MLGCANNRCKPALGFVLGLAGLAQKVSSARRLRHLFDEGVAPSDIGATVDWVQE